ncbi:MAG TPA: serine hydrolase domain-containing protein [Acidimicrobiales bacterium]|nr:serine hydrolase domain-containing protein [Acidimicrobiales bacterium]
MVDIQGTCDERYTKVRDVLASNLESGADAGASVAVLKDGELVVDIWGGTVDLVDGPADTPWQRDTLVNVYSSTKTMCNLSALVCADRGLIDLDAPVATYWPEFAEGGKDSVRIRHLLSHTAGLAGFEEPMEPDDLYDWEKCCARLAAQTPWWEPGTASGYHAVTQGYLVGEVVRRVTGKSLGTFFREELAEPLGADFHIGTGPEYDPRVGKLIPPADPIVPTNADETGLVYRTFTNPMVKAEASWTPEWRRAEIPAANGHGNARSIAQVQSIVSHGGSRDGNQFVSPATLDRIFDVQYEGTDLILGVPMVFGIGYGLLKLPGMERTCFWGGWGGSVVFNDLARRMTVVYVMNKMGAGTTGDSRGIGVVFAAFEAAGAE